MSLRPFFSFYGGKWRVAPRYPVPQHPTIIEPFAGSAGYSLRYPDRNVVLCDVDPVIIGTWQYLIGASEREIRALPLLGQYDRVDDLPVIQEAKWLIGWWLNKGMTTPCHVPSQWARNPLPGQHETYWGAGVRERIATQLRCIRHWRALWQPYDLPSNETFGVTATWFVDPPYQGAPGRRYRHGNRDLNYRRLGDWCRSRPGQVIVCENVGADWLPFEPFMIAKASAGKGRTGVSKEAIWLNRELAEVTL